MSAIERGASGISLEALQRLCRLLGVSADRIIFGTDEMCIRDRYINWVPMDEGNVLYNDKKFATLLYQWHCDAFTEYSKVSEAGAFVKNNIYDFIDDSEKTVLRSLIHI